jgi:molybdopterin converting factor small subunit
LGKNLSEEHNGPLPVEIKLHKASRILDVEFDDGKAFSLPCEYLRKESEELDLPAEVQVVDDLLVMLRKKGILYQQALDSYKIKVTVNKQFVPYETVLRDGDEIAMVALNAED